MKCPNCGFVGSDLRDLCPKCAIDLRPSKKLLGIKITSQEASYSELLEKSGLSASTTSKVVKDTLTSNAPKKKLNILGGMREFWDKRVASQSTESTSPDKTSSVAESDGVGEESASTDTPREPSNIREQMESPLDLNSPTATIELEDIPSGPSSIEMLDDSLTSLANQALEQIEKEPQSQSEPYDEAPNETEVEIEFETSQDEETIDSDDSSSIVTLEFEGLEESNSSSAEMEEKAPLTHSDSTAAMPPPYGRSLDDLMHEINQFAQNHETEKDQDYTDPSKGRSEVEIAVVNEELPDFSITAIKGSTAVTTLQTESYDEPDDELPESSDSDLKEELASDRIETAQYELRDNQGSSNSYSDALPEVYPTSLPTDPYASGDFTMPTETGGNSDSSVGVSDLFQDALLNISDFDSSNSIEISVAQLLKIEVSDEIDLLFTMANSAISNPQSEEVYDNDLSTFTERHVEAHQLEKQLENTEILLSSPVMSLRAQQRAKLPSPNYLISGKKVTHSKNQRIEFHPGVELPSLGVIRPFCGTIIDLLICGSGSFLVSASFENGIGVSPLPLIFSGNLPSAISIGYLLAYWAIFFISTLTVYNILALMLWGKTLGNYCVGLTIVTEGGKRPKPSHAIVRGLIYPISLVCLGGLPLLLGKRSLHDYMARLVVTPIYAEL